MLYEEDDIPVYYIGIYFMLFGLFASWSNMKTYNRRTI